MPDTNTMWALAFTFIALVAPGLAYMSYYHRDWYFPVSYLLAALLSVYVLITAFVNSVVIDVASQLLPAIKPGSESLVRKTLDANAFTYLYQLPAIVMVVILVGLGLIPTHRDK